jgi:hypothetical protein
MSERETFYGAWRIEVTGRDAVFDERFVITGSDNADGAYPGVIGEAVSVAGAEWILTMEWRDGGGPWQGSRLLRSATYTVMDGLIVSLGADDGPPATADADFNDVVLTCLSDDPDIDPNRPAGNPYDFSIPERSLVEPKGDGGHLPEPSR